MVVGYRRFGRTYLSQLHGSSGPRRFTLDGLTYENGTDKLYRNVGNQVPTYAAWHTASLNYMAQILIIMIMIMIMIFFCFRRRRRRRCCCCFIVPATFNINEADKGSHIF